METILNASNNQATPFSYGAGHVQPNSAMDPGLVYDIRTKDYLSFLCALGYNQTQISSISGSSVNCSKPTSLLDLNYPSITVPNLSGSVTVTRTLKNVGTPGTYRARVLHPSGIMVTVKPVYLKFSKIGEQKPFKIVLTENGSATDTDYSFGELIWSDDSGVHHIRSPITVKVAP